MFSRKDYPILEFDDNRDAKINPEIWVDKKFTCNKMIITFFPEVMDKFRRCRNYCKVCRYYRQGRFD